MEVPEFHQIIPANVTDVMHTIGVEIPWFYIPEKLEAVAIAVL